MQTLLALKAGRAFRNGNSNLVEPSPVKGALVLINGEDGLFHFTWKNRATGVVDEVCERSDSISLRCLFREGTPSIWSDLCPQVLFVRPETLCTLSQPSLRELISQSRSAPVLVPGTACLVTAHQFLTARQDASTTKDDDFVANINRLLQDPEAELSWTQSDASNVAGASSSTSTNAPSLATASLIDPEQLAQLQALLAGNRATSGAPDMSLSDILTPANLTPLFTSHPELIPTLFPHLPPDLPTPPSAEALQRIINSPNSVRLFQASTKLYKLGSLEDWSKPIVKVPLMIGWIPTRNSKKHTYSPYSKFPVGAALLAADGTIFKGANIENASYGGTICAERTAFVKAVSEGTRSFIALAVVSDVPEAISPCGMCRQVIREFCAQDMPILLVPADYPKPEGSKGGNSFGGVKETSIASLLPDSFGPEHLDLPRSGGNHS
ncbi:unnamed protein product [Mycena citricolor]|uniref:cytidine deaminase n=1 Tax=Mycena citricolor TaxID=2018698 RepID=A0AAD2HXX6_9AGAR|nr:unnamed protein product [Mycena citricolor]